MKILPHTRSCFVCGEANPLGLNLRFETDGRIVHARFVARREHAGFKGVVHGGLVATILDEAMVWACAVQTKQFAYCAELKVRFVAPAQPEAETLITAWLVTNRKGRIFEAESELKSAGGTLLASGTGKYLPLGDSEAAVMAEDFVGDPSWMQMKKS